MSAHVEQSGSSPRPPGKIGPSFHVERFADTAREAWPLIQQHAEEVDLAMGFPFQPNWEQFARIDAAGGMLWALARDEDGTPRGYAMWYVVPSELHIDVLVGVNEGLYFEAGHRNPWDVVRFLRFCEDELRRRGCKALAFDTWVEQEGMKRKNLEPLLRRVGMAPQKIAHWKIL